MTTECYYRNCRFHDAYKDSTEGPFCSMDMCMATEHELRLHEIIRGYELKYWAMSHLVEKMDELLSRKESTDGP